MFSLISGQFLSRKESFYMKFEVALAKIKATTHQGPAEVYALSKLIKYDNL
jgi:hypothetical protein